MATLLWVGCTTTRNPLEGWSKRAQPTFEDRWHHKGEPFYSVRLRESSMSTGIGFGIGIPHAFTDLTCELVFAVGHSKKGIQFDALDGQPVTLVLKSDASRN